MELPKYKCHKKVWALKIKEVIPAQGPESPDEPFEPGSIVIVPENSRYARFLLGKDYAAKHKPQAGGYYVVYDDGSKSYSPARAFEEGYSLIAK